MYAHRPKCEGRRGGLVPLLELGFERCPRLMGLLSRHRVRCGHVLSGVTCLRGRNEVRIVHPSESVDTGPIRHSPTRLGRVCRIKQEIVGTSVRGLGTCLTRWYLICRRMTGPIVSFRLVTVSFK